MNYIKYYLLFVLTLTSAPGIAGEQNDPLIFEFIENLPPYSYTNSDGVSPEGIDIAITKEIFSRLDREIQIEVEPWARILLRAEEGSIDGIGAAFCKEAGPWHKGFLTHSEPTYKSRLSIFARNLPNIKPLNGINELEGSELGKVRDYYYHPQIDDADHFHKYDFVDDESLLKGLQLGRVKYAISEDLPLGYLCKQTNSCNTIKKVLLVSDTNICLALTRSNRGPEVDELMSEINGVIAELHEEGFIEQVLQDFDFSK